MGFRWFWQGSRSKAPSSFEVTLRGVDCPRDLPGHRQVALSVGPSPGGSGPVFLLAGSPLASALREVAGALKGVPIRALLLPAGPAFHLRPPSARN
jgi:hypothetical protein